MLRLLDYKRRVYGSIHGLFKGRMYRSLPELFVESDLMRARQIADVSAKPVVCPNEGCVFEPSVAALLAQPAHFSSVVAVARDPLGLSNNQVSLLRSVCCGQA